MELKVSVINILKCDECGLSIMSDDEYYATEDNEIVLCEDCGEHLAYDDREDGYVYEDNPDGAIFDRRLLP